MTRFLIIVELDCIDENEAGRLTRVVADALGACDVVLCAEEQDVLVRQAVGWD